MALPSFGPRPPFSADFVAKVGGPLQVRNFRIQWARRLNQCCAAGLFFESMLRVGMREIFLQQYLPQADGMKKAANWGGLYHFKPNVRCLLLADFVAKVGGPLQVRNFRIQRARRLNQCCAAGLFFESMLGVRMRKFFLQQYRHKANNPTARAFVRYWTRADNDRHPEQCSGVFRW